MLLRPVNIPAAVVGGLVLSIVISSHAVKLFNADASIVAMLIGMINDLSFTIPRIQAAPSDVKFSLNVNDCIDPQASKQPSGNAPVIEFGSVTDINEVHRAKQ